MCVLCLEVILYFLYKMSDNRPHKYSMPHPEIVKMINELNRHMEENKKLFEEAQSGHSTTFIVTITTIVLLTICILGE